MRWTIVALLLLIASVPAASQDAKPPTKKEVTALVEEYASEGTPDARRTEIIARLKKADRGLAASPLKKVCENQKTVGFGVRLGTALLASGLFKAAVKFIDGDYEDIIVEYGLKLHEPDAAKLVWERWISKEMAGTSWSIANSALLKFSLPIDVITKAKAFLDGTKESDPLREPCARVLRYQLGLAEASIADINRDWKTIISAYELDAKQFNLSGLDLLDAGFSSSGAVTHIGQNVRLKPGADLEFKATDAWQVRSFSVIARVRVVEDCEIKIVIRASSDAWMAWHKKGEWIATTSGGDKVVPGRIGEWVTVQFDVTEESKTTSDGVEIRNNRVCTVIVGDKTLVSKGRFVGALDELQCWLADSKTGSCVMGGFEFVNK